jgi:peptide/nickel transport system permease protein
MFTYSIRRIMYMIPVIFGVAILTFLLFNYFGEDPILMALGQHASAEAILELQKSWGLDLPLYRQFLNFLLEIISFDYGNSWSTNENIMNTFKNGMLVSLSLTAPPFFIGTTINVCISLLVSYYRGKWIDKYATIAIVMSMSVSYLVYIIVMQYVFAYKLQLFPIQGYESGLAAVQYLVLPWIIITIVSFGPDIRIYRTVFLDQVKADYVRTARAKGASEKRVLLVHLLKNAMIPIITNTVIVIPFLITGAFVMERYFGLPGVGDLLITAINEGDFPVIKAMTMMSAILYAVFNLLTDILYATFDPRVKLN